MTGALYGGAGWLLCDTAGERGGAMATAIATPTPAQPLLFVINRARWRMYRVCMERLAGRRNVVPTAKEAQVPCAARVGAPRRRALSPGARAARASGGRRGRTRRRARGRGTPARAH